MYIWLKQTETVQKKWSLENRMKETQIEDRLLEEELKRKFKRTEIKKNLIVPNGPVLWANHPSSWPQK